MKMSFGYVPHQNRWRNLILKVLGYPNLIRRIQAPILMKMLEAKEDDIILDVGCGGGFFTYEIAKRCKASIGIDWNLNSERLSFVMEKQPNAVYVKGDVQKLPFASEKFDAILLSSVLQMVEKDEVLLEECYRVLKKDGVLVLSVPIGYIYIKKLNSIKNDLVKKFGALGKGFYGENEVIELLERKGFEILETEYAPKKLGSFLYEIQLYFCYRAGLSLFHPLYFPFLYPIANFDRFADKKQKGNEFLIKARKVSR